MRLSGAIGRCLWFTLAAGMCCPGVAALAPAGGEVVFHENTAVITVEFDSSVSIESHAPSLKGRLLMIDVLEAERRRDSEFDGDSVHRKLVNSALAENPLFEGIYFEARDDRSGVLSVRFNRWVEYAVQPRRSGRGVMITVLTMNKNMRRRVLNQLGATTAIVPLRATVAARSEVSAARPVRMGADTAGGEGIEPTRVKPVRIAMNPARRPSLDGAPPAPASTPTGTIVDTRAGRDAAGAGGDEQVVGSDGDEMVIGTAGGDRVIGTGGSETIDENTVAGLFSSAAAALAAVRIDTFGQLQYQKAWQNFDADAANNPGNAIFRFSDTSDRVDFRPEVTITAGSLTFNLSPRWVYNLNTLFESELLETGRESDSDFSLRYWNLDYFQDSFWIKAGRFVNWWGPARLLSPSNRYHADAGQQDPHSELLARDHLEIGSYLGSAWQVAVNWNFAEGEQDIDDFEPTGDIRLTWRSTEISATAMVSQLEEGGAIGGYGQWTFNDALIIYADALYTTDGEKLESVLSSRFEPTFERTTESIFSGLVGMSYTFENGLNVVFDYFSNGKGLDETTADEFFRLNAQSTANIINGRPAPEDIAFVSEFNAVPFFQLGTDYTILMLQLNNFRNDFDFSYLNVINLEDNSQQHTVNTEYRTLNNVTLYGGLNVFTGNEGTEFGRFFDNRVQLGVEYFF